MRFKYYAYTAEGLDGWVELSDEVQQKLETFDNNARNKGYRWIIYGIELDIGILNHAPGRYANYRVAPFEDQGAPDQDARMRWIKFDDGEMVEVRYVQEQPPFYEIGRHVPARV